MNIRLTRNKCWQREMREKKEKEELEKVGNWWESIDTSVENAIVKVVDYNTAKKVIEEYEWLGTMPSGAFLCVALYFGEHIAGVEVFTEIKAGGKFTLFNEKATCLARGCCVHWTPKWGSTYLISRALKILEEYYNGEPRFVIAYSDWEAGEIGTVYQASNWTYLGHTYKYEWRDPKGKRYDEKHHRNLAMREDSEYFKKHKKLRPEVPKRIREQMIADGWKRNKTCRGRYATVIGYKDKEKKRLLKILEENKVNYPKSHDVEEFRKEVKR